MIVLLHYPKDYIPDWYYNFFIIRESYIFVDFFFVLSGFVIAYNYNWIKSSKDVLLYLKKRFIRIYPLLFYTGSIFFLYIIFSKLIIGRFYPELFEELNVTWDGHIRPFIDLTLLTNSTPILGSSWGINNPAWSISAEAISYITFGLLLFLFNKKYLKYIFILIILFTSIFLYSKNVFFQSGEFGYIRGLLSFCSGFFVWKLYRFNVKLPNILETVLLLVLVAILYSINKYGKFTDTGHSIVAFILPIFYTTFIFCFTKTNGSISKLLESNLFLYLGKISYSIYLNHALILLVIIKPAYRIFKIEINDFNQILIFFVVITITIIYSALTYNFIELKAKKYLSKKILTKN